MLALILMLATVPIPIGSRLVWFMLAGITRRPSATSRRTSSGSRPSFSATILICSVVIPWFILQPGLGLGVMGRKTAKPAIPILNALANHIVYGIALYGGVWLAGAMI